MSESDEETDQYRFEEGDQYRFDVRILIKHPSMDPALISQTLGIEAQHARKSGEERKTPTGRILPGVYRVMSWGYSSRVDGKRYFFTEMTKTIDALESRREFLSEIVSTGGSLELIVQLPGDTNIGDTLPWEQLERLSKLKIDLGIEVFPHFS